MKKVFLFFVLSLVICGCGRIYVGNTTIGKRALVPISKCDVRLTITKDYVIVEKCEGMNGFDEPVWKCVAITNNDSTITNELIRKFEK